jgi:hypothetical protein
MDGRIDMSRLKQHAKSLQVLLIVLACGLPAASQSHLPWCTPHLDSQNLASQWDYSAPYGLVWTARARAAQPTPASIGGNATLSLHLTPCTMVLVAPQTFRWSKTQGQPSSIGFGTTKVEINHIVFHEDRPFPDRPLSRDFAVDYTLTLPTNGSSPIVENYAHQFLATFAWDQRLWMSYEVDAGDFLGARNSKPGYAQTALLTLIGSFNGAKSGQSRWNFPIEVDAGSASDSGPSSVISSEGASYKFKNGPVLQGLLLTGLTANDPKVGFALTIKYTGNLKGKPPTTVFASMKSLLRERTGRWR